MRDRCARTGRTTNPATAGRYGCASPCSVRVPGISNRQFPPLESGLSAWKERRAAQSNRQFSRLRGEDTAAKSRQLSRAKLNATSMPARGKFIVLEGIDGSGKRTQLDALTLAFARRGLAFTQISFPNYHGFFGKLVARYLNGEFGSLATVDPHFSALLYAGDRLESKPAIEAALASGKAVLADRYIGSNLAHQGARVPREKRGEFLAWLKQLEYGVYALPPEDLIVYLRVPVTEAHRLIGQKTARDYTNLRHDLHEADVSHLETAAEVYDELSQQQNWLRIECFDAAAGGLRAPAEIHEEILAAVESRLSSALGAKG
jgi:dTMP kinase